MTKRKTAQAKPKTSTLLDGYRSIPALKKPLSDDEMNKIVEDDVVDEFLRKSAREGAHVRKLPHA